MQQALLINVLDHRDQQAIRGVYGEADVDVLLADDGFAAWRQRAVEVGHFFEQVRAGLEQQRQHGQFHTGFFCDRFLCNAESFQLSDVSLIELRHVRDVQPAAMQARRADLHQAGHGHFFDFTETAEIDSRNRRNASTTGCTGGRCFFGLLHHGFDVNLHVFFQHTTVRAAWADRVQLDAELAGQLTHGRASVNFGAFWHRRGCRGRGCLGFGGWRRGRSRCLSCGRSLFSSSSWRRCSRGRSALYFELEDEVASANFVIEFDRNAFDHTGGWRWNFHAGLVGFEGDQRLISLNGVASLDQNFDDFGFARRADVRDVNVLNRRACRCSGRGRRGLGYGRGRRLFSGCRCRRSVSFRRRSGALGFQFQQFVAFFQAVAQLYFQAFDDARFGSRDFHARLVRFQRQNTLVGFDTVADFYKQFDDFTVTAADVRYSNEFAHKNSPQQSSGLRFSGLMPNLTMASATTLGSISPRSASASRAANTTK